MTALTYAVRDSRTMLGRNLRHMQRYPSLTVMNILVPVIFLLLFVYVSGAGLGTSMGGRDAYASYLTPGILLLTIAGTTTATAITVATDMTEGIIRRFRVMAISRASVLTGHVIGSLLQTLLALAAVTGVALGTGFHPHANVAGWFAACWIAMLFTLALTWVSVVIGLASGTVESASNTPMLISVLSLLGSGFAVTSTMPRALRWFANNQPFTPAINAVRALLLGGPVAHDALLTGAWSAGIIMVCYPLARRLYERDRQH